MKELTVRTSDFRKLSKSDYVPMKLKEIVSIVENFSLRLQIKVILRTKAKEKSRKRSIKVTYLQ